MVIVFVGQLTKGTYGRGKTFEGRVFHQRTTRKDTEDRGGGVTLEIFCWFCGGSGVARASDPPCSLCDLKSSRAAFFQF